MFFFLTTTMPFDAMYFIFISTLIFLFTLAMIVRTPRKKPLPPGPFKLPFVGNIFSLWCSLPHHRLRDLANVYGPIMHLQLGDVPTVVVSSSHIAKEIIKNHDLIFSDRPFFLAGMIMSYGSKNIAFSGYNGYWRQLRKVCTTELMSSKQVKSFRHIRESEVEDLLRKIYSRKDSFINLSQLIFWSTYRILTRAALGKECKEQETLMAVVAKTILLSSGLSLADMYPSRKALHSMTGLKGKLEKLHLKADKILGEILEEHKAMGKWTDLDATNSAKSEDLVDVLLRLRHSENLEYPFTDDNIKAVILDVIIAGCETTATTVEWALAELLRNPQLTKRAQDEIREAFDPKGRVEEQQLDQLEFLKAVVRETLRLHPSGPLLVPRNNSKDCVINGYHIPANTKLIVNAWAIQRDPDVWKDAENFDPKRFLHRSIDFNGTEMGYMPFGWGRRVCPGILFAIPDVELPLASILYHFDWKMADGTRPEDLDTTDCFGLTVRIKKNLELVPVLRRPLHIEGVTLP